MLKNRCRLFIVLILSIFSKVFENLLAYWVVTISLGLLDKDKLKVECQQKFLIEKWQFFFDKCISAFPLNFTVNVLWKRKTKKKFL